MSLKSFFQRLFKNSNRIDWKILKNTTLIALKGFGEILRSTLLKLNVLKNMFLIQALKKRFLAKNIFLKIEISGKIFCAALKVLKNLFFPMPVASKHFKNNSSKNSRILPLSHFQGLPLKNQCL